METKNQYKKPECESIEMEVNEIIAQSPATGFSDKGTSGGVTQAGRERNFWDD